jgi:hypothetical protein
MLRLEYTGLVCTLRLMNTEAGVLRMVCALRLEYAEAAGN